MAVALLTLAPFGWSAPERRWNARCLPSGDQTGHPSSARHFGIPPPGGHGGLIRWRSPPSAATVQIETAPFGGTLANTIVRPSGDQSGLAFSVPRGGWVSLRASEPSAFATNSSPHGVFS